MAGEIKRSDLINDDALKVGEQMSKELQKIVDALDKIIVAAKAGENTIAMADSLKKIQTETTKLTKTQQDLEKVQKTISDNAKKRAKDEQASLEQNIAKREHLRRSIKDLQQDQKEDLQLLKEQVITRKEYDKRLKESSMLILTYQQRVKELNKQNAQDIILTKQLGGEYSRLVVELQKAETKYRDLLASSKANGNEVLAAGAAYAKLNKQVREIDNLLGKFHRNVGNYPKIVQTMTRSVLDLVAAFGIHDGIRMFAHSVREVIALSVDFESANSRLAGVLGKQKNEIENLRKQQMELAKVTLYNAKNYAELQIELAKLGFPISDIEKMTESTARASIAMGSDLAEQAELTGSILHQYGLQANQTARVNDALSKSTTSSALDFRKLATAMPYVGSAASALGFTLEETLALMGQLSNTGLAASTVGTSLRKIFLLLADSSSSLSKKLKEPVRDLPSLLKGLKELKLNNTELAEALELTDIRSVIAFQALIDGADKVEVLNKTIQDSAGFTEELAHTVKDNLGGDMKLAGSAVDSLAISLGETLEPAMRSVVQAFTYFVRALGAAPKFLKENKDLIFALIAALLAFRTAAVVTTLENIALSRSFQLMQIRLGMALNSFRAFLLGIATNPFAVFLLGLAAVITGMNIYERTLGRTAQINKLATNVNSNLTKTYQELNKALADVTVTETEYARLTEKEKKNRIDIIRLRIAEADAMALEGEQALILLKAKAQELSYSQQNLILKEQEAGRYENARKMAREFANANFESNEAYKESQKEITANVIKLNDLARGLRTTIEEYAKLEEQLQATNTKELSEEEFKRDAQRRKALLDLMIFRKQVELRAQEEISSNEEQDLADRLLALRNAEQIRSQIIELERKKSLIIEKKGEVMAAGEIKLINEKAEHDKTENSKKGQEDRTAIVQKELLNKIKLEEDALKASIQVNVQSLQAQVLAEQNVIKIRYAQGKISKEQAEKELRRVTLDANKKAINDQITMLQNELMMQQQFETQRLLLVAGSAKEEAEIRKESADDINAINIKIAELRQQLIDQNYEGTEHVYQDEIDMLDKLLVHYQAFGQAVIGLSNAIAERKIANIDKEIRAVNDWESEQLRLAGDNDKAKEQIELQAEARRQALEKRKLAEQRKAAVREKVITMFEIGIRTALNIVKAFPNPVLMAAAATLGAIQAATVATKPLPQFKDGGKTATPFLIAGEEGAELYKTPAGQVGITPNRATVMNLPIGTEIYPHEESMRALAMQGLNRGELDSISTDRAFNLGIDKMIKENRSNNKQLQKLLSRNKPGNLYKEISTAYEVIEDEKRNKKRIRKSNFGF